MGKEGWEKNRKELYNCTLQKLHFKNKVLIIVIIPLKPAVLVKVTVTMMKHHDKSNLGRGELIWLSLPHCCASLKKVRTGTPTQQKPAHRNCCRSREAMLPTSCHEFLRLLTYRKLNHQPMDGTTYKALGSPTFITNWKNAHSQIWRSNFFQLRFTPSRLF